MALVFKPKTGSAHVSEVVNYSIVAETVSTDATDSAGSTGSMNITLLSSETVVDKDGNRVARPGNMRATALLGREVSLTDYGAHYTESKFDYQKSTQGKGSFVGVVSSMNSSAGGTTSFDVDGLLFKFNCEKTAEPHFGATATQKTAFVYYCSLAGVTVLPGLISSDFDIPVAYAAWKGNVWEHLKMFCVANKAEIFVSVGGQVTLRKIRKNTISVIESSNASMSVNLLGNTRSIEMYHYDNSWEEDAVIYSAETTFQLNKGEQRTELVDMKFSTTTDRIIQPECVERIMPNPFVGGIGKSVYVVIDSLNYPVKPEWWNNNGGKVYVSVSEENPAQLEIKLQAPNQENSAYVEPFSIAQYDTDSRPALYICGEGVEINKKLRTVATAADETFISRDSKATVDNPFITDISYHLLQSSAFATGPTASVSLTIGKSNLPYEINEIAGSRFMHNNGYYRVMSANLSDSGIGLTGKADTTFDDLTLVYSETFGEYNSTVAYSPNNFTSFNNDTNRPSNTFAGFNSAYPAETFDQVGESYTGLSFSDMAFMPLGDKLNLYGY